MANGKGKGKGKGKGDGWRQRNSDGGGDCWRQPQQLWSTATATVMSNGRQRWQWQQSLQRWWRWRRRLQWQQPQQGQQLQRYGCLFMCRQCAALWQGLHIASTPIDTKKCAFTSAASWGWHCKEFLLSFQGGGFLTAHHGLLVLFIQVLFSLLTNPLFAPRIIQALKNPVSPLTLYLLHSYFIFLQR